MIGRFLPEGKNLNGAENIAACATLSGLRSAGEREVILEGMALSCGADHELTVSLGPFIGHIPRAETALGISEGTTREIAILSRVGKPVCFTVTSVSGTEKEPKILLSRRRAQELAQHFLMCELKPGIVLPATVTHLESFGAFVDIGCGLVSLVGIEQISVSRIPHPSCRFTVGQEIYAAVVETDPKLGRVKLTHRELLGTWEENARHFTPGMTVAGTVRGIKEYGAFIELAPNLSGLAEPRPDLKDGDRVSVFIKAILPDRMKIKLLIIDRLLPAPAPAPLHYYITAGRITRWIYAPEHCQKSGPETDFTK